MTCRASPPLAASSAPLCPSVPVPTASSPVRPSAAARLAAALASASFSCSMRARTAALRASMRASASALALASCSISRCAAAAWRLAAACVARSCVDASQDGFVGGTLDQRDVQPASFCPPARTSAQALRFSLSALVGLLTADDREFSAASPGGAALFFFLSARLVSSGFLMCGFQFLLRDPGALGSWSLAGGFLLATLLTLGSLLAAAGAPRWGASAAPGPRAALTAGRCPLLCCCCSW